MAIRPLDMQVMVPHIQEVAQMKHTENQRSNLEQNYMSNQNDKNTEHEQKSVSKSSEDQNAEQHADAREKGNNAYNYEQPNKKHKKENEEKEEPKGYHKIDVRI